MDTVIELLLSAPDWVVTYALPALVVLFILGLGWCALRATAEPTYTIHDEPFTYENCSAPSKTLTRREGLDEILAGRWEWDDYLEYFRGKPDDGSLSSDKAKAAAVTKALESLNSKMLIASGPHGEIKPPMLRLSSEWDRMADRLVRWDLAKPGSESTVVLRRKKILTIHPDRIRTVNGELQVWQPSGSNWVPVPKPWHFDQMSDGRLHFTMIGGKNT